MKKVCSENNETIIEGKQQKKITMFTRFSCSYPMILFWIRVEFPNAKWAVSIHTCHMHVQMCWNLFAVVRMVWARAELSSLCTVTGAHTWPNARADPTCRQLCSQILIKSGLQRMCESRFRKEWLGQWSPFGSWKWRLINHWKSRYIIMFIILFIVMRVPLLSVQLFLTSMVLQVHSFCNSTHLRCKYMGF